LNGSGFAVHRNPHHEFDSTTGNALVCGRGRTGFVRASDPPVAKGSPIRRERRELVSGWFPEARRVRGKLPITNHIRPLATFMEPEKTPATPQQYTPSKAVHSWLRRSVPRTRSVTTTAKELPCHPSDLPSLQTAQKHCRVRRTSSRQQRRRRFHTRCRPTRRVLYVRHEIRDRRS